MSLIQQHMENVAREEAQHQERLDQLKAEQDETRKLLGNIRRYRKSLQKQYPSSQAVLPLVPPDDEEEEEATDEADDREPRITDGMDGPAEPLVPDEWSPDYETPSGPADAGVSVEEYQQARAVADAVEPEKPIRRRRAKAAAEE